MSDIYFSNVHLENDTDYFLYIGEIKSYGINLFLRESLSKIHGCRFDFISVVPDVLEDYPWLNVMVLNPLLQEHSSRHGSRVSCRVPAPAFMASVSKHPAVTDLVHTLLGRQKNVFIYMHESVPELTLDEIPGVSILGPDREIAHRLNSKIVQYTGLTGVVPLVEFKVCDGLKSLVETTDRLWEKWPDGIFVSHEYSAAGINAALAHRLRDITDTFVDRDATYLISRYLPHRHDPTVLAVVANERDIYIAGVADQCIEGGIRFTGSTFPSVLKEDDVSVLKEHTRAVGKWMAKAGYRGIYGCDFLIDYSGGIHFLEINARKQGTTMEFCCTLEQSLPPGSPMLPELEYFAVTENRFPDNTREMENGSEKLHWGTYNVKIGKPVRTGGGLPNSFDERGTFRRLARTNRESEVIILEHVGSDCIALSGSFLGRVVALGSDHSSVGRGIEQGKKTIERTIVEERYQ